MKLLITFAASALLLTAVISCKKSYTIGGSKFVAQVDMTTYDYLKTNHLFDTLVIMIDAMGLSQGRGINQAGTLLRRHQLFHPQLSCLAKQAYLQVMLRTMLKTLVYTFDSLDLRFPQRHPANLYMFKDRITRDNISQIGEWRYSNEGDPRVGSSSYQQQTTPIRMYSRRTRSTFISQRSFPNPAFPYPRIHNPAGPGWTPQPGTADPVSNHRHPHDHGGTPRAGQFSHLRLLWQ